MKYIITTQTKSSSHIVTFPFEIYAKALVEGAIIPRFLICFFASVLNPPQATSNRTCRAILSKQDAKNPSTVPCFTACRPPSKVTGTSK